MINLKLLLVAGALFAFHNCHGCGSCEGSKDKKEVKKENVIKVVKDSETEIKREELSSKSKLDIEECTKFVKIIKEEIDDSVAREKSTVKDLGSDKKTV